MRGSHLWPLEHYMQHNSSSVTAFVTLQQPSPPMVFKSKACYRRHVIFKPKNSSRSVRPSAFMDAFGQSKLAVSPNSCLYAKLSNANHLQELQTWNINTRGIFLNPYHSRLPFFFFQCWFFNLIYSLISFYPSMIPSQLCYGTHCSQTGFLPQKLHFRETSNSLKLFLFWL